jgi:hypothetical protein
MALNGVACIIGMYGITIQNDWLSLGSHLGGLFFLAALFPLGLAFWREIPMTLSQT